MNTVDTILNAINAEFPAYAFVSSHAVAFVAIGVIAGLLYCLLLFGSSEQLGRAYWPAIAVMGICGVTAIGSWHVLNFCGPFSVGTDARLLAELVADPNVEVEYLKSSERVRIAAPGRREESEVMLGRSATVVIEAREIWITKKEVETLASALAQHAPDILARLSARRTIVSTPQH